MDGLPLPPSPSPSPSPSSTGVRMKPPQFPNVTTTLSNSNIPKDTNQHQNTDENTQRKKKKKKKKKKSIPTPKELIAHYESQGMNSEEASLKVIQDLQNVLFRVVSSRSGKKSPSPSLEVINSRLVKLEMKLDSKPGYGQTLAIGVAAGVVVQGIGRIGSAFAQIWNSVSVANSSKP